MFSDLRRTITRMANADMRRRIEREIIFRFFIIRHGDRVVGIRPNLYTGPNEYRRAGPRLLIILFAMLAN